MAKQKIKLPGVAETLLIPLWARAEEWNTFEPIIMDEHAVNLVKQIDYDFSKFEGSWLTQVGCSIRARILDVQTKRFIQKNPETIIINIGAGLDTRFFRVDNGKVNWYELDLPEAIEIKKNFFQETERYNMIPKSVFDFSWFEDIKEENKPVFIIAEGTLMYFEPEKIKELFDKLIERFSGAEVLVETTTPFIVKNSRKHEALKKMAGLVFKWGIKNPKEIEKINPKINMVEKISLFDCHKNRWRSMGKLSMIPWVYNNLNNNILRLKLG